MPTVLTLAGVEAELYPERAEFGRRKGSRNRFGRKKKGSAALGRTTTGKLTRAAGAAAALGGAGYLLSKRGGKGSPITNPSRLLSSKRGGALTKTNISGKGGGDLSFRRKLSLGERAANAGRGVRRRARGAAASVRRTVARSKQRLASKSYRIDR